MEIDAIVVGSGFAGSVLAERLANVLNKKVLVIEKRNHIAGNMYDYERKGIFIHKYGPHIFHTNDKEILDYLSQFTKWVSYQHKVLGIIDGEKIPIPFNLNSLYALLPLEYAKKLEKKLIENFGYGVKIPILELKRKAKEIKDKDLEFLADFIFEKVFLNYTRKQWEEEPENLLGVTERVPILISKDDRYFQDKYQFMPKDGYTKMFERMLNSRNIKILLNTDYKEVVDIDFEKGKVYLFGKEFEGIFIYTGMIDYFFNYKYGKLPYRSLRFEFEEIDKEFYQDVAVENYPNNYDFTRITEFKHFYKDIYNININKTIIAKEYPEKYTSENEPYYPIPKKENLDKYEKYKNEVEKLNNKFKNVKFYFVGRLAEYKYYNMDIVVKRALDIFKLIKGEV